ncbi:MAG: type II toxin-antitoxin system RelE/ParE family toxin [Chitinophagaceae bacterium]|nr:type II toxin-antitoxin system RelE/ParE family toxin [Chitinophagaceae bacterium]
MNYKIETTDNFIKELKPLSKKYRSLKADLQILNSQLQINPIQGSPLGKNCYKIRLAIASKRKGKSGGARIITCVKIIQQTVFLLSIFDKSDIENISNERLTEILKYAESLS